MHIGETWLHSPQVPDDSNNFLGPNFEKTCVTVIIQTKYNVKVFFALVVLVEVLPVESHPSPPAPPPPNTHTHIYFPGRLPFVTGGRVVAAGSCWQSQIPFLNRICQVEIFLSYLRSQMETKCKVLAFR